MRNIETASGSMVVDFETASGSMVVEFRDCLSAAGNFADDSLRA